MILGIGCSHSAGPYDSNDGRIETKADWPTAVAKHTNEKYRHIAIPGQGILSYYEVLKYLEEQDLLRQFDKLLIQLTQEPRIVTSRNPEEIYNIIVDRSRDAVSGDEKFKHTIFETDTSVLNIASPNTLFGHIFNGNLTKNKPKTETKIFIADLFDNLHSLFSYSRNYKNIFDLVYAEIVRICERNDIKLFDFAWDWSVSHANDLTRHYKKVEIISPNSGRMIVKEEFMKVFATKLDIDYQSNKKWLKRIYNEHTNKIGHFTPVGEMISHEIIIKYLKSTGFFNEGKE